MKVADHGVESMQQNSSSKIERKEKLEAAECCKRIGHSKDTQNIQEREPGQTRRQKDHSNQAQLLP